MPALPTRTYSSELYKRPALTSSAGLTWPGVRLEHFQLEAMTLPAHYHAQHLLLVHQGTQPLVASRQSGRRLETAQFGRGNGGLYSGGEYGLASCNGPADTIHVNLDAQALDERGRRDLDLPHFALHEQFRLEDALLAQLVPLLLAAAHRPHLLGQLYAELLLTTLCYHLIEHHATLKRRPAGAPGRGCPRRCWPGGVVPTWRLTCEALVTLEALVGLANLSVFHFARRFKHTTGRSPHQYVLDWKIRRARALLRAGELPVAATGDALGFSLPAHFSAAFKRTVGQRPLALRHG